MLILNSVIMFRLFIILISWMPIRVWWMLQGLGLLLAYKVSYYFFIELVWVSLVVKIVFQHKSIYHLIRGNLAWINILLWYGTYLLLKSCWIRIIFLSIKGFFTYLIWLWILKTLQFWFLVLFHSGTMSQTFSQDSKDLFLLVLSGNRLILGNLLKHR